MEKTFIYLFYFFFTCLKCERVARNQWGRGETNGNV